MSLTTKPTINRQEKTEELYAFHDWQFKLLGEDNPVFIPKCAYVPKGMGEQHIGFFLSEVKKGKDIYTEFTSIDLDPEDPTRTLYKWRFNPHYEEEYEKTEPAANGHIRYLVPVSELIKIDVQQPVEETVNQFPDFDEYRSINDCGFLGHSRLYCLLQLCGSSGWHDFWGHQVLNTTFVLR